MENPMPFAPRDAHRPMRTTELDAKALREALLSAWHLNDALFSGLKDDDAFLQQPDPRRNPLVFYYGHGAAFSVNKLRLAGLMDHDIDPHLQQILGVGVDPATAGDRDADTLWPTLSQVRGFRDAALDAILAAIDRIQGGLNWDDAGWAILMAIDHERIHFESSSVLIRQLPVRVVRPPKGWDPTPASVGPAPQSNPMTIPAKTVTLGRPSEQGRYGWDNEFGTLQVKTDAFAVDSTLVSNGAFLAFIDAGGYADPQWWCDEGWAWRETFEVRHPAFWRRNLTFSFGDAVPWKLRTVFDERPLPLNWPVEVCHHEADAYCRWRGGRLPSEVEWVALAQNAPRVDGDAGLHPNHYLALQGTTPRPVDAGTPTSDGIHDVMGNVWQWLADGFRPLPGFRPHPFYADFSEPYFDDDHRVLRGGSWASTGGSASEFYRLWFRPSFMQHAGFRVAWSIS